MKIKYSCVIDNATIFQTQAFIFVKSLLYNQIEPSDVFVHTTKSETDDFLGWLTETGVNVLEVAPFDERNKYCNKLTQLATFQNIDDFDYVFLMDCDMAVVNLDGLELKEDVYAKVVDFPNPPAEILKAIYKKVGFQFAEIQTTFALEGSNVTDVNNCNGGLYIISKEGLNKIAPHWIKWANWSIENADLFTENYSKHADQVGFALAMAETNFSLNHLDISWNFPIHVSKHMLPNIEPNIIHFHSQLDNHMKLKPIGLSNVDMAVNKVNSLITDFLSSSLDNRLFWNNRYKNYPQLGSGVGSRGEILDYKRRLLKYVTFPFKLKKVLDVGCGDLEFTKTIEFKNYLGIDLSNEALELCRQKRPDWDFQNVSINDTDGVFDLVMCFDVLIHQSSQKDFENLLNSICEKSQNRILIGAYANAPEFGSDITYYYYNFIDYVKKHPKFSELSVVGNYRDITVLSATISKKHHIRDIESAVLNTAYKSVKRPDLLQYLVDVSRHYFDFFTSHYPRVFEYTWLLEHFEYKSNQRVLDIGAGVCPLPLCLAELGHNVITVDSHPVTRKLSEKPNWNEWGFLDYNSIDDRIISHNLDFGSYKSDKKFDCIYSISVIEHMPKSSRIRVLKKARKLLKKNGELLLTIDIVPNTNKIWNRSEDKQVEDENIHGTVDTFKSELKKFGFNVVEEHILRNIEDSRTDVWFVKTILKRKFLL